MKIVAVLVAAACGCASAAQIPVAAPAPPPTPATSARQVRGADHVAFASLDADLTHGAPTMIDAWIMRPATPGPHPAIVLLHGCAGLWGTSGDLTGRHRDWAERLVAQGYIVLLPDSFGSRKLTEICSRDKPEVRPAWERSRDAYGALAFLQQQPDVDPARIGLFGWSHGGSTVLATLAPHIRARPGQLAHDFKVAIAFYPGCTLTLRRADWMPVAPLHVLIGASDNWTTPAPCVELIDRVRAAGAAADIVVYPDAFHDFDAPNMRVHDKTDVATTATHTATIGTNPAARADAIERVARILHEQL
jgi:dienelactone hydrolase